MKLNVSSKAGNLVFIDGTMAKIFACPFTKGICVPVRKKWVWRVTGKHDSD